MIVVVLISHDLVKDGVPPRFGGLGDGRSISSRRAVQRILDFAAAGLARLQKLMGLAIVGDDSRPRGLIEHDMGFFDHKCRRTRHGVIAVRLVNDVDRSGITGIYVVCVADLIFVRADQCIAVNDCSRGRFGIAVIGIADKGVPVLVKQRDGRVLHRLGGDGDRYHPHCGIAVVGVALYLIIHRVSSGIGLSGDAWLKVPIRPHTVNHRPAGPGARSHKLLGSGTEDKRVARRLRAGDDLGLLLPDGKAF